MRSALFPKFIVAIALLAFAGLAYGSTAPATPQIKVTAQLVWGTNDETSPDAKHKPVDPELAKKLSSIFKWKNYFRVSRKTETIPLRGMRKMEMSNKFYIEVTDIEKSRVEVKVYGDNKLLNKTVSPLVVDGDALIIAGDDKNAAAWFVVLQAVK
jgi:hypothetical protein